MNVNTRRIVQLILHRRESAGAARPRGRHQHNNSVNLARKYCPCVAKPLQAREQSNPYVRDAACARPDLTVNMQRKSCVVCTCVTCVYVWAHMQRWRNDRSRGCMTLLRNCGPRHACMQLLARTQARQRAAGSSVSYILNSTDQSTPTIATESIRVDSAWAPDNTRIDH